MGNIYIDLSEEIEDDLLNGYQSFCDELSQGLANMSAALDTICTDTSFKPLVDLVNSTITLFNDEIYKIAEKAFKEWCEGTGSFSAVVNNSQAGEAALATARSLDASIKEIFDTFWTSHPLGEAFQIDTSRPKIASVNFTELKEIYDKNSASIQKVLDTHKNIIREKAEEDVTYETISPAYVAVSKSIEKAFARFAVMVTEENEKSENLKKQQDAKNAEAVETATKTAATAEVLGEAAKDADF